MYTYFAMLQNSAFGHVNILTCVLVSGQNCTIRFVAFLDALPCDTVFT